LGTWVRERVSKKVAYQEVAVEEEEEEDHHQVAALENLHHKQVP
jgi:hypothetical protein